jgi:hypothetical protein
MRFHVRFQLLWAAFHTKLQLVYTNAARKT